jgi:hypothetical protein
MSGIPCSLRDDEWNASFLWASVFVRLPTFVSRTLSIRLDVLLCDFLTSASRFVLFDFLCCAPFFVDGWSGAGISFVLNEIAPTSQRIFRVANLLLTGWQQRFSPKPGSVGSFPLCL